MKARIVAEVTRNWDGSELERLKKPLISQRFEQVIKANSQKGFELESWHFSQVPPVGKKSCMMETIVAVFVREG